MIFSFILDFILGIAKTLFNFITGIIPGIDISVKFAEVLGIILETTTQANNFIYFIVGDLAAIIVPELIILIVYKYVAYPIISFILQFVHNAG